MRDEANQPASGSTCSHAPQHVAIIMDGNGRWANQRGKARTQGHQAGVESVRRCVRAVAERGIPYLSLFSFSSENWLRPQGEISFLFGLLRRFIRKDLAELHKDGVRIRVIGSRERVPEDIIHMLDEAEALTRDNTAFTLVIAFNYGGRQEIAAAARRAASAVARGEMTPGGDRRGFVRGLSRYRRHSRSRSAHPYQRRKPHLELPAVAVRLRRIRLPAGILARFRRIGAG